MVGEMTEICTAVVFGKDQRDYVFMAQHSPHVRQIVRFLTATSIL